MMRGLLTFACLMSVIFFPWPFAAFLALVASLSEPFVPLAAGLFADTLYYTPSASALPFFTLIGAAVSAVSIFVRSRLRTGSMR